MRLFLAIKAFFAILFTGALPKGLPAPEETPERRAERERLVRELEELKQKVGELERALEDARARLAGTSAEREELLAARSAAERLRDANAKERDQAISDRDAAQRRLEETKGRLAEAEAKLGQARADGARSLLAWLQREGRLIDFLRESIGGYDDAQVGAAARAIHAGCKKVLEEGFAPEPILGAAEGERVKVEAGFDPVAIQLSGQVKGSPPFEGTLVHHGWRGTRASIPVAEKVDTNVLAPAEVEL